MYILVRPRAVAANKEIAFVVENERVYIAGKEDEEEASERGKLREGDEI